MIKKEIKATILKLFCIFTVLIFSSDYSFGQIFIKGSGYIFPTYYKIYNSFSVATEYKKNRIGIEYQYKFLTRYSVYTFIGHKHQLGLKYYIKNTEGGSNIYVEPFINMRNSKSTFDYSIDTDLPITLKRKGYGYGISLGYMKNLFKYFGFEIAPYLYNSHNYFWNNYYRDGRIEEYIPNNYIIYGLKLFLYFKIPIKSS